MSIIYLYFATRLTKIQKFVKIVIRGVLLNSFLPIIFELNPIISSIYKIHFYLYFFDKSIDHIFILHNLINENTKIRRNRGMRCFFEN